MTREQERFGLTDDFAKILYMQPGVNRIPEAGSSLLIYGESPYDNRYIVCGVPVMTASHFSNHNFADVSGLAIETLNKVSLVAAQNPGRYRDASGATIILEPEIYRPSNKEWKPRPELALNAGTLNHDLTFSVPARKDDYYQFTATHLRDYSAGIANRTADGLRFGREFPQSFVDGILTGKTGAKNIDIRSFGWLALDIYDISDYRNEGVIPWGIAGISVSDTVRPAPWKISAGGSRQHFYEGKPLGTFIPQKHVERSNAVVSGGGNGLKPGLFDAGFRFDVEYLDWNAVLSADGSGINASGIDTVGMSEYRLTSQNVVKRSGRELAVGIHGELSRWQGRFGYGASLLGSAVVPYGSYSIDPGIWSAFVLDRIRFDVSGGIVSSQPDIRGLPSEAYRGKIIHTWQAFAGTNVRLWRTNRVFAEGFIKRKDHCPQMSKTPGALWWEPSLASPLFARGVNIEWRAEPLDILSWSFIQNFSKSERVEDNAHVPYEWDMPWSSKAVVGLHTLEKTVSLFLTGVACAGLPYRDIALIDGQVAYTGSMKRMPVYKRIDVKLQFMQPGIQSRHITRFDAYAEMLNVPYFVEGLMQRNISSTWMNTREYYWDSEFVKHPVALVPYSFSIGLRLGFRL
jgi:hypothetical protein